MLEELNIENVALIENAKLSFTPGLNVLTGETGAGKSILLGALGLLLGDRADKSLIRRGAQEAVVSGILRVEENQDLKEWAQQFGIAPDEGSLILRRTLKEGGRGSVYIQSQPVTAQALKELSLLLFDIHGQHQHQSLFHIENHRKLLDRYGKLEEKVEAFSGDFREFTQLRERIHKYREEDQSRVRELELAQFALNEIEGAQLKPGEDQQLMEQLKKMEQKEQLLSQYQWFHQAMEGDSGILGSLKHLRSAVDALSVLDAQGNPLDRYDNAYYELEDLSSIFSQAMDSFDFSPQEQQEMETRLALIHGLEHKYRPGVEGLLEYAEQCRELLAEDEQGQGSLKAMEQRSQELEQKILNDAKWLSQKRKEIAQGLEQQVESHLKQLGMDSGVFQISLLGKTNSNGNPSCGPYGSDRVEFLFSANRGEPLQPLKSVASGGEISRIMLAIKTAFAQVDQVETMVFDEIDTGIGGQVALSIGEHFRKLSRHKQIFCITHLASIASFADNHIKVLKEEEDQRTTTKVMTLDSQGREEEIARMLAGDSAAAVSLEHARELLGRNGLN